MKGEKVTRDDVLKLREKTGAGVMPCKKALLETNNDEEAAIGYLRNHPCPPRLINVR